jgi:MFS family permease
MKARYIVLLMLTLLSIITYMDRICIGVLAGPMQEDLGISDAGWGWVISAFLIAYGLFEIPTGALGDLFGQRKMLTRIVVWWSAFTMLTGVATNYYMLVATRFLFGAGEAGAYPNASGCIRRWFPAGERGRAQGLVWGASRVGGALTPLVITPLLKVFPWQAPFFIFGMIGLVWAVVWYVWFRDDPAQHPAVSTNELAEIEEHSLRVGALQDLDNKVHPSDGLFSDAGNRAAIDNAPQQNSNPYAAPSAAATDTNQSAMTEGQPGSAGHSNVPWRELFLSPRLWLIIGMYWFYVFGAIFFMFALTKYFIKGRGLSDHEAAIGVSLAFAMGAIGNAIGGWTSDRLSKRFGLWVGRCLVGAASMTITGLLLLATALTPGKLPAVVLLAACFGIMDGMLPAAWSICLDVGKQYSGAVSGAMNTAGQAAGALCMVLYGYFIQWTGNYEFPLIVFAMNMFVSAIFFLWIDPTQPLISESRAEWSTQEPACV